MESEGPSSFSQELATGTTTNQTSPVYILIFHFLKLLVCFIPSIHYLTFRSPFRFVDEHLLRNSHIPKPTQTPIQWVAQALSLGVKRPEGEADHSPPSSAVVKNAWSYTSNPPIRLHGVVLS
jgi:hypothetical protein